MPVALAIISSHLVGISGIFAVPGHAATRFRSAVATLTFDYHGLFQLNWYTPRGIKNLKHD